ncbi:MAG: aminotransferase class I/II-fold pyridoxal phosphate-dependent enzyme [Dehalococcoidia bacterium]|nr:aminotransferase class I/II-fold pyridoxal phosphate-dependent enzyme [Dehalococcoidia bacterium]
MTSSVVSSLPSSGIRRFFEMLDAMEDVISLGVGQPDFATPAQITRAAMDAMVDGRTGYTSNYGLLEVRELLSQQLSRRYGVDYSPKTEILLTTGVSEALDLACRALIDPGDEVLVPEPAYVAFQPVILLAGGRYVPVPTTVADEFMVAADQLEERITPATKAVLLAYPSNPTGAVMSRAALEAVADVVRRHDLWVISDETYDRLVYGHEHVCFPSIEGMRERTVLLGGFSKAYAMTGWRLGFAAAPPVVLEEMMKVHQYVMMSAPSAAQYAALEALRSGEEDVRGMTAAYNRRRQKMLGRLRGMGLPVVEPRGAFYIFPDITSTGLSDLDFCERLLQEERVAVIPGSAFGDSGKGYVRICYASSDADLEEAMNRLERFLARRRAEVVTK